MRPQSVCSRTLPLRLGTYYVLFGLTWIVVSDAAMLWSNEATLKLFLYSLSKGMLFVLVSGFLIFLLLRHYVKRSQRDGDLIRTVLDTTPDVIFAKDLNGRYILFNSSAAEIAKPALVRTGLTDAEIFAPQAAMEITTVDREVINSGRVRAQDIEFETDAGRRIHHSVKAPLRNRKGEIEGVVGISRDVTELHQVIEQVKLSENRLRMATTFADGGVWDWNLKTGVAWWSPELYDLWGVPAGTVMQLENSIEIIHPDDRDKVKELVGRAIETGGEFQAEFRILHFSRGVRWMLSRGQLLGDGVNELRLLGISIDISSRKQVELKLAQSEQYAHTMLSSTPNGLYVFDILANAITYTNPMYLQITGLGQEPNQEITATMLRSHVHDDDIEELEAHWENVQLSLTNEVFEFEFRFRRHDPDEQWIWLLSRHTVLNRSESGKPIQILGWLIDITSRKQLERELLQSQKMEAVGRLSGGVAHDFNNLLTVINGYSELLMNKLQDDADSLDAAKAIYEAGERASALTKQLLMFSRQAVSNCQTVEINELLTRIQPFLKHFAGSTVDIEISTSQSPNWVVADPIQLDQILLNLAANARDAMPAGGTLLISSAPRTLTEPLRCSTGELGPGNYVNLTIKDTGTGFEEETKARIFEPFFSTKPAGQGVGLGLAVVHGIITRMGGQIQVESSCHGTEFSIFLPTSQIEPSNSMDETNSIPARLQETILVVDDEPQILEFCRITLEANGYLVRTASSGRAALEVIQLQSSIIDLIISDVVMPGMSGWELVEKIGLELPDARILVVSGYTEENMSFRGSIVNRCQFLSKPFTSKQLLETVRRMLVSTSTDTLVSS